MIRIDPGLVRHIADLSQHGRERRIGGLWGVFDHGWGRRSSVNFVHDQTKTKRLATGTDPEVRDRFADTFADLRRERDNIALEQLQAFAAVYGRRGEPRFWQTVVIERTAARYRWASPNGTEAAVAAAPEGMDALGFLSLALPELLADLIHHPESGHA